VRNGVELWGRHNMSTCQGASAFFYSFFLLLYEWTIGDSTLDHLFPPFSLFVSKGHLSLGNQGRKKFFSDGTLTVGTLSVGVFLPLLCSALSILLGIFVSSFSSEVFFSQVFLLLSPRSNCSCLLLSCFSVFWTSQRQSLGGFLLYSTFLPPSPSSFSFEG
jgi:hypothetical protein